MKKVLAVTLAIALFASLSGVALAAPVQVKELMVDGRGAFRTDVGNLYVEVVDCNSDGINDIKVWFETEGDWELQEVHAYAGVNAPDKSSPGKFPAKSGELPDDTTLTSVCVIMASGTTDSGDVVYIAAHADVINPEMLDPYEDPLDEIVWQETAWAQEVGLGDLSDVAIGRGKNWATCFQYTIP